MNDEKCMMGDCVNGGLNLSACFSNNYIFVYYFIHHDKSGIFKTVFKLKTTPVQKSPPSSIKQHQLKKVRLQA